jgi:hypothetical protein
MSILKRFCYVAQRHGHVLRESEVNYNQLDEIPEGNSRKNQER